MNACCRCFGPAGAALAGQALGGLGLPPVALLGPAQAFGEPGGVEPGRERPGESAGPEQAGVAVGYQVTERDEADQPALHLPGVDLAIAADTGQMQRWLVGLVPFRDLIASGHARLLGPSRLGRAFPTWFDTTWFAEDLRRAEQRHRRQAEPA